METKEEILKRIEKLKKELKLTKEQAKRGFIYNKLSGLVKKLEKIEYVGVNKYGNVYDNHSIDTKRTRYNKAGVTY